MARSTISRRQFHRLLASRTPLVAGAISTVGTWTGCTTNESKTSNGNEASASASGVADAKVSNVPVRAWCVGTLAEPESLIRQWQSVSEQPIEVRLFSQRELLALQKCDADLLLYPSRMIGDLLQRGWIVDLPTALSRQLKRQPAKANEAADLPSLTVPDALRAAAGYDGTMYGIPIGFSMISLMGSSSLADEALSHGELAARLETGPMNPVEFDESTVDRDALIDRFLSLAIGLTERNTKYGVLFELRDMKARLASVEFLRAAEMLRRLASQPEGISAVVGSHATAWSWIHQNQQPAFALLSVSHLTADVQSLDSAHPIRLTDGKPWNDGSGMIVSLTANCQQTKQSTQFIQWLSQTNTQETMRYQIPGMTPTTSRGNSLADRLSATCLRHFENDNLICEPRMPMAHLYRSILAEQLIRLLEGSLGSQVVLNEAATRWDEITSNNQVAKDDYQRSLGLLL